MKKSHKAGLDAFLTPLRPSVSNEQTSGLSTAWLCFLYISDRAHPSAAGCSRSCPPLSPQNYIVHQRKKEKKEGKKRAGEMRAVADFTAAGVFFGEIKLKAGKEREVERIVAHIDVDNAPVMRY